jgi:hypothetical protein
VKEQSNGEKPWFKQDDLLRQRTIIAGQTVPILALARILTTMLD